MNNSAYYSKAQRRRRVFIFAYKNSTEFNNEQNKLDFFDIVFNNGFFAKPFRVKEEPYKKRVNQATLPEDHVDISDNFSFEFHTAGIMQNVVYLQAHVDPLYHKSKAIKTIV